MVIDKFRTLANGDEDVVLLLIRHFFQKNILGYLSQKNISSYLVFQGGTSLKIVYGSPRYSMDLDFVKYGNRDADLKKLCAGIDQYMREKYPDFDFELKIQKDSAELQRVLLKISHPSLLGKMRILIEKFDVPAYTFIKFREKNIDILVESTEEILADKIIALIFRKFLKGRDVFDVYYLTERGVSPNMDLIKKKIEDYGEALTPEKIRESIERLRIGREDILRDMEKFFLPADKEKIIPKIDKIIQRGIDMFRFVEHNLLIKKDREVYREYGID